jgi:hypothetical protein
LETGDLPSRIMSAPLVGHSQASSLPSSSGVYAAWLESDPRCLYVGRAGNSTSGNLRKRILSHYSGQRGSDQFCLYVYDSYVHAERAREEATLTTRQVNQRTAEWIRRRVSFRVVKMSEGEAAQAEQLLRRVLHPILNPL